MEPVSREMVEQVVKTLFPDVEIKDVAWIDINPSMVSAKVYLNNEVGSRYMDEKTHQPAHCIEKRLIK